MSIDLTNVLTQVKDSDEPLTRAPGAGRPSIDNPFGPVLKDSMDNQRTKLLTVKNDEQMTKGGRPKNVVTISGLIRRAADAANLGVRIVYTEDQKANTTTIKFAAKEKTKRTRSEKSVETANDKDVKETPKPAAPAAKK